MGFPKHAAGLGGKARAKKLSAKRRLEIARKAIRTRWDNQRAAKRQEAATA